MITILRKRANNPARSGKRLFSIVNVHGSIVEVVLETTEVVVVTLVVVVVDTDEVVDLTVVVVVGCTEVVVVGSIVVVVEDGSNKAVG